MAQVGSKTYFSTIADHPLLTLALSPTKVVMVLASPELGTLEYYVTILIRSVFVDPFWFMIGVWYGNAAIRWMNRRMPTYGQVAQQIEGLFPQFGWLFVILYSSNALVIVLAGASTMRLRTFLILDVAGTAAVAFGVRQLGWVTQEAGGGALTFLDRYQPYFIALSVALLLHMLWQFWSTRDKHSISTMQDELEVEASRDDQYHPDDTDDGLGERRDRY